jgi:acetyltransferase-like isoleucine patch superfamily enzyme
MPKSIDICIPRETVNDDVVTIVRWHQPDGSAIRAGDKAFSIETSKAILDVEAPSNGWLEILKPEGSQVPVGQVVAHLHDDAPVAAISSNATVTSPDLTLSTAWFSDPAKKMIERHQINPAEFTGQGLVRTADIQKLLKQRLHPDYAENRSDYQTIDQPEPTPDVEPPTDPSCCKSLWADARDSAGQRGRGIFWLILNYFFRNYLLGLLVRIAPRGLLIPLHRLRGVKIGKGCYVDPTAILETAYPEKVTLGDDVRVAARAVIMTHIKGPHYLRQQGFVPTQLKPVVLEDHCFIGVNSVILPGVTVGKAAVVASGAVVTTNVTPLTMVTGNPAQIVKRFTQHDRM